MKFSDFTNQVCRLQPTKLLVLTGGTDLLRELVIRQVQEMAWARMEHVVNWDGTSLKAEDWPEILYSDDLFFPASFNIVRRCRSYSDAFAGYNGKSLWVVVMDQAKPPPKQLRGLSRIHIPVPRSYEIPVVFDWIGEREGVRWLKGLALEMHGVFGEDLLNFVHFLRNFRLMNPSRTRLESQDLKLATSGDFGAFKLTDYLLDGEFARADTLMQSLLDRGENPLALLALLTGHLRTANKIVALELSSGEQNIARRVGLPPFILKKYQKYVAKHGAAKLRLSHQLALEGERLLKSTSRDPGNIISSVIRNLA